MSTTHEQLSDLSPQAKRELLAKLLREQGRGRAQDEPPAVHDLPRITPDPARRHEPFPLTDIQQAYWLGRSADFELGKVGIHGYFELDCVDLDIERLNVAWRRTVERHDMMRAVILPDGSQRIMETAPPYDFEVVDLRGMPPETVAARLAETRERMSHQVFDPERWPLFDIRASRLDDRLTRLHFSEDALHADMMSTAIILDDWLRLYENPGLDLPPPELSFRDYAIALERVKESDVHRRSLAYWRERVKSLPGAPELPFAKSPGALAQTRFTRRSTALGPEAWQRLKASAAAAGVTASSLLLAAYAEVLGAWSSNPRFCINVTVYNRLPLHPQVEQIAGDFTSMIFLEVDRTARATFAERARLLQRQLWNDLAYRYVSGVEILRELARTQGRGLEALMPVVFTGTLGTAGYRSLRRLGELAYSVTQTPQVILDQQVFEEDGGLVLSWDAVEELFPAGVLERMFEASSSLLSRLADDERCWHEPACDLINVTDAAQSSSAGDVRKLTRRATLHELFSEQAARRPQQPAVITPGRTLTYGELEEESDCVARRLRAHGVTPGRLVAVAMEKGWEQVVAVLGVLKAGGAYLPVDAGLPAARRQYLLEDGRAEVVLTQPWLLDGEWPSGVAVEVVGADAAVTSTAADAGAAVDGVVGWEELAYVIYTSGSTGKPKGVMIEHRNVVNRMLDVVERFGITSEDRVLALTALHHDLSVFDIFGMLAVAGGTVVIPEANALLDPHHWLTLIERERVTVWNSVPAFMQMLVESLEAAPAAAGSPRSLRLAMLSGDWIPVDLPDRIRAVAEATEVVSLGGPTETTVWDICYPIEKVDLGWKSIPYGRPMTNAGYYILKDNLEPCPTWVTGELCIAGAGLARGYWRDEEKTAVRFITHPQTGERLYRSGDLGRYLPDGNIEILGRKDFQIKIRGHRIELGEIESVLRQHPRVDAAVATVLDTDGGFKQLAAYVVPRGDGSPVADSPNGGSVGGESLDALAKLEFQLKRHALRVEPNCPRAALPAPERSAELAENEARRRSHRSFLTGPVSQVQLGAFLACLKQLEPNGSVLPRHRYPSAANLYPVQTYLYVKPGRVEGLAAGVYYYHPVEHALVTISPGALVERDVHATPNQAIFDGSAFSIFLVGRLNAVAPLYPDQARDFCLLEAGYMGQLLMSVADDHGLGLCPIGGLHFAPIRPHFALGESHELLHSFCGGAIPQTQDAAQAVAAEASSPASCAPCTSTPGETGLARELRSFLAARIPDYMIPQRIVLLDSLPLTSNGKINRDALPRPTSAAAPGEPSHRAPKSELEQRVAEVWQEVLGLKDLSTDGNFFDLGATSLHLVRARAKLQDLNGGALSVVDLFRHPTVSALARFLASGSDDPRLIEESNSRAETRRLLQQRRGNFKA